MADEANATAAAEAANPAAQVADTADTSDVSTQSADQANGKARDANGRFAGGADVPEWRKVLGKRAEHWSSEVDLAKSYLEADKRLSKALVPPDEKAPDEQKTAWRDKLLKAAGIEVPEKPDAYGVALADDAPDDAKANLTEFLSIAHKTAMSKAQVAAALQFVVDRAEGDAKAGLERLQRSLAESEIALRREWRGPGEFELNYAIAKDAVRTYGDEDFRNVAEMKFETLAQAFPGKSLNELPAFAKTWANVGRKTGAAQVTIGNSEIGRRTKAELTDMYNSPRYAKDPEFRQQVDAAWRATVPADSL